MWVKTNLPVPVIRALERLVRMAQALMKKSKVSQNLPQRVEFGKYEGQIIGTLRRREIYGDSDDSAEPARGSWSSPGRPRESHFKAPGVREQ
jgi:hypothetical protein